MNNHVAARSISGDKLKSLESMHTLRKRSPIVTADNSNSDSSSEEGDSSWEHSSSSDESNDSSSGSSSEECNHCRFGNVAANDDQIRPNKDHSRQTPQNIPKKQNQLDMIEMPQNNVENPGKILK